MIIWTKEGNTHFAISENYVRDHYSYEEVLWAEIDEKDGQFVVSWEDSFNTKHPFFRLEAAKNYVEENYIHHNFTQNGRSHFLG